MNDIPDCPECGEPFENIFDATDHLVEPGDKPFDVELKLPSGYTLMVGSLLRTLYNYAGIPEKIEQITQDTFGMLYAAQYDTIRMKGYIEDLIIREQMSELDEELAELLDKKPKNDESGA